MDELELELELFIKSKGPPGANTITSYMYRILI
jgi:hypothetical protein